LVGWKHEADVRCPLNLEKFFFCPNYQWKIISVFVKFFYSAGADLLLHFSFSVVIQEQEAHLFQYCFSECLRLSLHQSLRCCVRQECFVKFGSDFLPIQTHFA
jgi:hypothetical protein